MASKPTAATRASARTKAVTTVEPPTTRTTRARAAMTKAATLEAPVADTKTAKKTALRKPLLNRENSVEVASSSKVAPKQAAIRKLAKQPTALQNVDREPIMVSQVYYAFISPLNYCRPTSESDRI